MDPVSLTFILLAALGALTSGVQIANSHVGSSYRNKIYSDITRLNQIKQKLDSANTRELNKITEQLNSIAGAYYNQFSPTIQSKIDSAMRQRTAALQKQKGNLEAKINEDALKYQKASDDLNQQLNRSDSSIAGEKVKNFFTGGSQDTDKSKSSSVESTIRSIPTIKLS